MGEIIDFNEHRMKKMTTFQRMVEVDRQAKILARELADASNEVRSAKERMKTTQPRKSHMGCWLVLGLVVVSAICASRK